MILGHTLHLCSAPHYHPPPPPHRSRHGPSTPTPYLILHLPPQGHRTTTHIAWDQLKRVHVKYNLIKGNASLPQKRSRLLSLYDVDSCEQSKWIS